MSHFRTHVANTPQQFMRLIELAVIPILACCSIHITCSPKFAYYGHAIRTVRERLWEFYVCENDRGIPARGLIPWRQVFATLAEIGFEGYIGFEALQFQRR